MHASFNGALGQKTRQFVTTRATNRKKMVDRLGVRNQCRQCQRRRREPLPIASSPITPAGVPIVEKWKFEIQYSCLHSVHAVVETDFTVFIFRRASVIPKPAQSGGEICIVCSNHSAVSVGAEILSGRESQTREPANATNIAYPIRTTM